MCMVYIGKRSFVEARGAISRALKIMEELGLHQDEEYGGMLSVLGSVDSEQGRCKEALVTYHKAKAVLVHCKDGREYGTLANDMAICYEKLRQVSPSGACDGILAFSDT
jgi:hypothetical protein